MRKVFVLSVLLLACLSSLADASLSVGDRIRFTDQVGTTGGGEFGVHLKDHANPFNGNTESAELFRTFCLEKNEFIDFHKNGFVIESISTAAENGGVGGPSPDPISAETAWLYYNFARGTLSGYLGDVASADNLQKAIWGFEDELTLLEMAAWSSNPFVLAAQAAILANGSDVQEAKDRVQVLNIRWASDRHGFDGVYEGPNPGMLTDAHRAQSMLYVIPEASTIAVWSILSAVGVVAAYRRRSRQTWD